MVDQEQSIINIEYNHSVLARLPLLGSMHRMLAVNWLSHASIIFHRLFPFPVTFRGTCPTHAHTHAYNKLNIMALSTASGYKQFPRKLRKEVFIAPRTHRHTHTHRADISRKRNANKVSGKKRPTKGFVCMHKKQ